MRHLKLLGLALAALFVLGIATAGAAQAQFTLPDLSLLPGEEFPLHLNYESATRLTKLSNPVEVLEGKGLKLLILCEELSALCKYLVTFENVKTEKGVACNTPGDAAGIVLVTGEEVHLVSFLEAGVLKLGELFLVANVLTIECGSLKIKVRGQALSKLSPNGEADQEEIGGVLTGNGAGKPTYTTYYNSNKEEVKAKLESNFGTGYKESAEEVEEGAVTVKALSGKMFKITLW